MKVFVALCVLLPLAMAAADAEADAKAVAEPVSGYQSERQAKSYGHVHRPRPVQTCHTVYDTTYEKVCKTIYNKACTLVPTTQFRTELENLCTKVPETVCVPTTNTITEQACSTYTEQACTTEVHTTYDTVVNQECQDIEHQVCQETRVSQHTEVVGVQQHAEVISHQVGPAPAVGGVFGGGLLDARFAKSQLGHHINKRESKPESEGVLLSWAHLAGLNAGSVVGPSQAAVGPALTAVGPAHVAHAPQCQVQVERRCRDVPVQVPRQIQVPKCVPVPKTHCVPVQKVVPGPPACHNEPREVCGPVSRAVPFEVQVEQCTPVAEQVCKDVPHKAAREVCNVVHQKQGGYEQWY